MCVWVSCAFLFPNLQKAAPTGVLSKTFPNLSLRTGEQLKSVCFLATLQYQTWACYLWVSIYILLSTLCTLYFKASAFSARPQPCWGFLFPPHLVFCFHCLLACPSASFYVCVESFLEFAGQGWALKEMDFSQHWMKFGNWNMPFTNLIYPPNWKAREELKWRRMKRCMFWWPGSTQLLKMLSALLCVEFKMADVYSWPCAGEADSRCNWSNLQQ